MNEYYNFFNVDPEYARTYQEDYIERNPDMMKYVYPKNEYYQESIQKYLNNDGYPEMMSNDMNVITDNLKINELMPKPAHCGLYDVTEGFLKGNMFPNLYKPYKNEKVKNIIPKNERERELLEIQKFAFCMKDINLYLDVHPEDKCMIDLYNEYSNRVRKMMDQYQKKYESLDLEDESNRRMPWNWSTTRWPWEGGY